FFFLTNWGDLESDTDVVELNVYRTRSVLEWLAQKPASAAARTSVMPYRSFSLRSRTVSVAIEDPQWNAESSQIKFLGRAGSGTAGIYTLDVLGGSVKEMVSKPSSSSEIDWVASRGDGVVYAEHRPGPSLLPRYPVDMAAYRNGAMQLGRRMVPRVTKVYA